MSVFRSEGRKPKRVAINVTICDGGLGDLLCYLTVVDYMLKHIPWVDPYIWVPDYLLSFAKHVLPPTAKIGDFTRALKKYNDKLIGVSTRWNSQHTPMRLHAIDYAAHVLIDADIDPEHRNYIKFNPNGIDIAKYNLPEKYIAISVGSTNKTKELPANVLQKIVDYVKEKGYTPVFLGKKYSAGGGNVEGIKANLAAIDYTSGIDLCDKTDLLEACAVIQGSKTYIGMDGGLSHLAGYTDRPLILGYSFVSPDKMTPIRKGIQGDNCYLVVPEESLACRYCQTRMPLVYEANFLECWYGPEDYTCIKQLTFEKWKEQIDKAL